MTEESYHDLMKPAYERYAVSGHCAAADQEVFGGSREDSIEVAPITTQRSIVTAAHDEETRQLRSDILARIFVHSPEFFENLIIDVILRMGYGHRRRDLACRLGRSGDGGVDGVIAQDELGLDLIYLQAKRLRPGTLVPISQVRDFAGSLEAKRASKGILVTTAQYSAGAHEFVRAVSRRVVLISGEQLADIMIRHNIGVKVRETYQFKDLEPGYFRSLADPVSRQVNP